LTDGVRIALRAFRKNAAWRTITGTKQHGGNMAKKFSTSDIISLLTAAGLVAGTAAIAADSASGKAGKSAISAQEHTPLAGKNGKDNACGEGACGTDEKGAKAAQEKHKAAGAKSSHHASSGKAANGGKKPADKAKSEATKAETKPQSK
jgi:hypothetical protein